MKTRGLVFDAERSIDVEPDELYDRSRYGNDGTSTDITWVQLPSGLWVMSFNGTTSFVDCTNSSLFNFTTGDFSILTWVKFDSLLANVYLVTRGISNTDGYIFWVSSSADVVITTSQASAQQLSYGNDPYTASGWHLIATTRSGTSGKVYANGVDVTTTLGSHSNPLTNARKLLLGIHDDESTFPLVGDMALPRIWNRALSARQIRAIFDAEAPLFGV